MSSLPPRLIGRDAELAALLDLVEGARGGSGGVAFVEGEAGIGKTRLISEGVAAGAPWLPTFRAAAAELDQDRPYAVILDALRASVRGGSTTPAAGEVTDEERVVEMIDRISLRRPAMLALEDLHWADDFSLRLIARLARRLGHTPLVLLLSARPTPRGDALHGLLRVLHAVGGLILHLQPLRDDHVVGLADDVLSARPGPRLTQQLQRSSGNPLFVLELLNALEQAIEIRDQVAEVETLESVPGLRLTIVHRLRLLSPLALEVVRLAAVLGAAGTLQDLVELSRTAPEDVAAALQEAIAAGVMLDPEEGFAFRHDLVREAIYDDLPHAVRKDLHRQAGRVLAHRGAPISQVAAQMSMAATKGDREATGWILRAARTQISTEPGVAVELTRRALELTEAGDERAEVLCLHTEALTRVGDMAGALAAAEAAVSVALDPVLVEQARVLLVRASIISGRERDAIREIDDLLQGPHEPRFQAMLMGARAQALTYLGDLDAGADTARTASEMGESIGSPECVCLAGVALCWAEALAGRAETAVEAGERALAADRKARWDRKEHAYGRTWVHAELGISLMDLDRHEEAERVLREGLERIRDAGDVYLIPPMYHSIGILKLVTGEWDDGWAEIEAGLELAEETGQTWTRPSGASILAVMASARGDTTTSAKMIQLLDEDARAGGVGGWETPLRLWASACIAFSAGRVDEAAVTMSQAWSLLVGAAAYSHARLLGPTYVRICLAAGNRDALAAAVPIMEAVTERTRAASALACAKLISGAAIGDVAELGEAVDLFAETPRTWDLANACECTGSHLVERRQGRAEGVSLLQQAVAIFRSVGASNDEARVNAILRRAGVRSGSAGPRGRATTGWASLTRTEEKVVDLISRGLTNGQVAEQLVISRRTVETHVSHIFQKLGLNNRTELVARATDRARLDEVR